MIAELDVVLMVEVVVVTRELVIVMVNGEDEVVAGLAAAVVIEVEVVKLEFRLGFQVRSMDVDWNSDGHGEGDEIREVLGMASNIGLDFQLPDMISILYYRLILVPILILKNVREFELYNEWSCIST